MDINNHFDAVVECCEFLETVANDEKFTKADVIESVKMRMHVLLKRSMCSSTFPYMSITGWKVEDDVHVA